MKLIGKWQRKRDQLFWKFRYAFFFWIDVSLLPCLKKWNCSHLFKTRICILNHKILKLNISPACDATNEQSKRRRRLTLDLLLYLSISLFFHAPLCVHPTHSCIRFSALLRQTITSHKSQTSTCSTAYNRHYCTMYTLSHTCWQHQSNIWYDAWAKDLALAICASPSRLYFARSTSLQRTYGIQLNCVYKTLLLHKPVGRMKERKKDTRSLFAVLFPLAAD